jgi:SAM-dependent methyltransferase
MNRIRRWAIKWTWHQDLEARRLTVAGPPPRGAHIDEAHDAPKTPGPRGGLPLLAPLRAFVHQLATQPRLWNLFRRILEDNFKEEKKVIRRELLPRARAAHARTGERPRILDLGCGTGELAPIFLRNGYNYVGIDIEAPRIAYAQKVYPTGTFKVMDATGLRFPDGYFDHILVTGVFHHLSDEEVSAILVEMRRVLRPTGRALVMEDTASGFKLNILGALVHLADEGSFIRRAPQYEALFTQQFQVRGAYCIRSGVCDYQVFVLEP